MIQGVSTKPRPFQMPEMLHPAAVHVGGVRAAPSGAAGSRTPAPLEATPHCCVPTTELATIGLGSDKSAGRQSAGSRVRPWSVWPHRSPAAGLHTRSSGALYPPTRSRSCPHAPARRRFSSGETGHSPPDPSCAQSAAEESGIRNRESGIGNLYKASRVDEADCWWINQS